MAISSVNTYNTVTENTYATQKKQVSGQEEAKADKSVESKAEKILSEKFFNAVDGEIYLNETDLKTILHAIRLEEQEKTKSEPGVGMTLDLKI